MPTTFCPLMYCYLYTAGSGLLCNKCPYYEICAHQFHIKHDKKAPILTALPVHCETKNGLYITV